MFIKVTRAHAVSALAAGYAIRLDATGEIWQLDLACHAWSKRACRRFLSSKTSYGFDRIFSLYIE